MAFIDFNAFDEQNLRAGSPVKAPEANREAMHNTDVRLIFSEVEWRVLELAREDTLASLRPSRRRTWVGKLIFGPEQPTKMFANERLEALRKLAVNAWHHGYTLPVSVMKQALAAGFSEAQVGHALDTIVRLRSGGAVTND